MELPESFSGEELRIRAYDAAAMEDSAYIAMNAYSHPYVSPAIARER
jgi:hypothetical protein